MGSSSSDSNNSTAAATTVAAEIEPVPQTQYKTTGYAGMGNTAVPNTYTQEGKPSWMKGAWDMPQWGTNAATGQPLTQQQLQPNPAPAVTTAATTVAPQAATTAAEQYIKTGIKDYDDLAEQNIASGTWTIPEANTNISRLATMHNLAGINIGQPNTGYGDGRGYSPWMAQGDG